MKRAASTSLIALLLSAACGGLARDPEGTDDSSGGPPPAYSGPLPAPAAAGPVSTGPTQPTFGVGTSDIAGEPPPAAVVRCDGYNTTDFGAMHLSTEWDHISLLSVTSRQGGDSLSYSFEAAVGYACNHARYPLTCQDAYAAAQPQPGGEWTECGVQCRSLGIVLTYGDQVLFYDSRVELQGLLGLIDSEHEAALWARINGYRALCGRTIFARQSSGNYLLAVGDPPRTCGEETDTIYLLVTSDGNITEQRRELGTNTPGCYDTIE